MQLILQHNFHLNTQIQITKSLHLGWLFFPSHVLVRAVGVGVAQVVLFWSKADFVLFQEISVQLLLEVIKRKWCKTKGITLHLLAA